MMRRTKHPNAPFIGALVGAVVVPATLYIICHRDRDCGTPATGGMVLGGMLGALAGLFVGLQLQR